MIIYMSALYSNSWHLRKMINGWGETVRYKNKNELSRKLKNWHFSQDNVNNERKHLRKVKNIGKIMS